MNDDEFGHAWTMLEPASQPRRRIDAQVAAWLEARDTPLVAEWVGVFRVAPAAGLGLVTVSAVSLLAAPPLVWFARALI